MNILVITGGNSSERKISLISSKAVKNALEELGHIVKLYDLKKGYQNIKKIAQNFDLIFPVLHGEEGEGGKLHKFLSALKKPYVGGNFKGYKNGWYKIPFKKFCIDNQIPTASYKVIKTKGQVIKFGFPSVLKTTNGGSSKEVVILKSETNLKSALAKKLLKSKDALYVEKFLPGIEITVAVLGNTALPVIEIVPPKGAWFDYRNKYGGEVQEIPNAPSLDEKTKKLAQNLAEKIHQILELGQISRTDMIVSGGKINVLEVNTIPGMTPNSLLPKAAKAIGLSFPQLMHKIIQSALKTIA